MGSTHVFCNKASFGRTRLMEVATLTIDGKKVMLQRKSYIHTRAGATFRWSPADNPVTTTTVPEGSAGLEVLFRE